MFIRAKSLLLQALASTSGKIRIVAWCSDNLTNSQLTLWLRIANDEGEKQRKEKIRGMQVWGDLV